MPDIFLPADRPTKLKLRAARIGIENVKIGEKTVTYHEEQTPVFIDDGTYATPEKTDFTGSLTVPFSALATTIYEIHCPVTGQTIQLSGAAIALWLEEDFVVRETEAMNAPTEGGVE